MKKLIYIFNILLIMFVFASCKDENVFVSIEDEPFYSILVSIPDNSTRATYKEDGEDIAVVWEKGDVINVGTNEFVFKEMQGNNALFFHYGDLSGDISKVMFDGSVNNGALIQEKNNKCYEVLEGDVPSGYNFKPNEVKEPIALKPSNNNSLLHIQAKSPAMFMGGSSLKLEGLDKDYTIQLGENPKLVFADVNEQLNIYITVPSNLSIKAGDILDFSFCASGDGDEYHYRMKCNALITTKNNEVVKMPLPNKPTHIALQMGLPSGTKWATTNVGASKESEAGDYFAWGEIEPAAGGDYSPANCKAYNMNLSDLRTNKITDNNNNLTSEFDVATQNWGDDWRMPTKAEFQELINNCTREIKKYGDFYGWEFRSKVNNNSIFIPNAGHYDGEIYYDDFYFGATFIGDYARAFCWSATGDNKVDNKGGYSWSFDAVSGAGNKYTPRMFNCYRSCGRNVRPVIKN